MKHLIVLGLLLVLLSAVSYLAHYAIFGDAHHIFIYLVGDIAFVPIELLLVTLIIHRLLESREKRSTLKKLNMVIGAFFSEVGTELLGYFADFDPQSSEIRERLVVTNNWSEREFSTVGRSLEACDCVIDREKDGLGNLRVFLMEKRSFLLALLGNPNLLEHESFTDLLWAVFHLAEELAHRTNVRKLPDTDYEHLAGDIKRAYKRLISEWLDYMKHLKAEYPYLFSLAIRTNPFDRNASPEVR